MLLLLLLLLLFVVVPHLTNVVEAAIVSNIVRDWILNHQKPFKLNCVFPRFFLVTVDGVNGDVWDFISVQYQFLDLQSSASSL